MTSETDLFYEEKLAAQRASADAYMASEDVLRPTIRRLDSLLLELRFVGENYMDQLTYSEAALFHNATEMVSDLLASIHDRRAKA